MANNYIEAYMLASHDALVNRVSIALTRVALDVSREPVETPNHDMRMVMALSVLRDPRPHAPIIAMLIMAANLDIGPNVRDSELYDAVTALWDDVSGKR